MTDPNQQFPPQGQPGYGAYGAPAPGAKPPNNLVWGILTTLLCCLPFGVVSIVFATQVDSKWNAGDYQGAIDSANKAKTWAIVAGIGGFVVGGIYVALIALGAFAADTTYSY